MKPTIYITERQNQTLFGGFFDTKEGFVEITETVHDIERFIDGENIFVGVAKINERVIPVISFTGNVMFFEIKGS